MDSNLAEAIQAALDDAVAKTSIPGVAGAVSIKGVGKWVGASGRSYLGRQVPVDPNGLFPIFSITKTFVSASTLLLVGRGLLSLGDSLATWFPDIPNSGQITVRHMLSLTSGIPDYADSESYHQAVKASPGNPWAFDGILACALENEPEFVPGHGWGYSNINYWLVGRILELVTASPLAEILSESIFVPLGLGDTVYPEEMPLNLSRGYSDYFDGKTTRQQVSSFYHPRWAGPAGAIVSTASDVAKFFDALFDGELLAPPLLKEITTLVSVSHDDPSGIKQGYSLGIMRDEGSSLGPIYGHSGAGPGYLTMASHAPELGQDGVTAVFFCNCDYAESPDEITYPVMRMLERNL